MPIWRFVQFSAFCGFLGFFERLSQSERLLNLLLSLKARGRTGESIHSLVMSGAPQWGSAHSGWWILGSARKEIFSWEIGAFNYSTISLYRLCGPFANIGRRGLIL